MGRIWQKLKGRLLRKLLTDRHSAFLHSTSGGTIVKLELATNIDSPLFIESGIILRIIRLKTRVSFRKREGGWAEQEDAIIDTSCPVSVIPRGVWMNASHHFLSDEREEGIAGERVMVRLGVVTLRFHDEKTTSPPLRVKADLAESDTIPLILGFEDVITEILLVCDFKEDTAYAMFRH